MYKIEMVCGVAQTLGVKERWLMKAAFSSRVCCGRECVNVSRAMECHRRGELGEALELNH